MVGAASFSQTQWLELFVKCPAAQGTFFFDNKDADVSKQWGEKQMLWEEPVHV